LKRSLVFDKVDQQYLLQHLLAIMNALVAISNGMLAVTLFLDFSGELV